MFYVSEWFGCSNDFPSQVTYAFKLELENQLLGKRFSMSNVARFKGLKCLSVNLLW